MRNNLYLIRQFEYGDLGNEEGRWVTIGAVLAYNIRSAKWCASIAKIASIQELENEVLFSIQEFKSEDNDGLIFKLD